MTRDHPNPDETAEIRNEIELDEWVVMPNHFHGVLVLTTTVVGAIHESPLGNLFW